MVNSLEEQILIKRILNGEKELYEILVRRNNQLLYRVVKGYIKDEFDIEEIMQVTFVKAFEKLNTFNLKSKFSTWLIRIAINESLQFNKRINKHSPLSKNEITNMESHQLNPEKMLIMNESTKFYEKAISELEPLYHSVFILKEIEQMSIKDISTSLEITESNVKVRLHRAKQQLKELLYNQQNLSNLFLFGNIRCDNVVTKVMSDIQMRTKF